MDFEKSSAAVKSEEHLSSTEESPEKNCDIPPDKCTCLENLTCDFCHTQEYKKAWRALTRQTPQTENSTSDVIVTQKPKTFEFCENAKSYSDTWSALTEPLVTDKNTLYSSETEELHQDGEYYSDTWSTLTETVATDKSTFNDNEQAADENCDTDSHCDAKLNEKRVFDHVDTDTNSSGSLRKFKDRLLSGHLEQSMKSCDIQTGFFTLANGKITEETDAKACTDAASQISRRNRRNSKRKRDVEDSCPICGLTIRSSELESHFTKEVENLSKIPKNLRKIRFGETGVNNTYVQVKCNRENRLSAKVAKYATKATTPVLCPVCTQRLTGSEDEINDHVLNCAEEDSFSDVNVTDREDSFEEYEFGNETRVRAISFVPGGYRALEGQSSKSITIEDNDEDVNVDDVDDTLTYGKPQYTELDVIHNLTDARQVEQLQQLRKALLPDPTIAPQILESRKWAYADLNSEESKTVGSSENADGSVEGSKSECTLNEDISGNKRQAAIVSSLKEKIKNLEEQNSVKCLICLDPYTKPVVSTVCWHVHCEECWLMTMGVKKLCPQCNLIVLPSDLRRIYL